MNSGLGVANVRGKLDGFDLLRFVASPEPAGPGNFHFACNDTAAFRAALVVHGFRLRDRAGGAWDARERVARASLHIKHFVGWPEERMQAHIDPYGIGGAWILIMHLLDYNGYRDAERILRLLA